MLFKLFQNSQSIIVCSIALYMKFCLFLVLSHFFGLNFRGFTKFSRTDYVKWKQENRILPDGVNAKVCCCYLCLIWSCLCLCCYSLIVLLTFGCKASANLGFCSNLAAFWLPWTIGEPSTWKSVFRSNFLVYFISILSLVLLDDVPRFWVFFLYFCRFA